MFAVAAAAVCADLAVAVLLGYPLPVASVIALAVAAVVRRRAVGADKIRGRMVGADKLRRRAVGADRIRRPTADHSGVQARRTVLLVIVLLGLQPLLWHWILDLLGDSAASAVPVRTAFGQVLGWLGTVAMGAALVAGVCSWFVRDRRWPVTVTGILALVVCGVFAVAGLLMTVVNPTLPLLLGLLLVGVLLWLPLVGVATAGRRCLVPASTVRG